MLMLSKTLKKRMTSPALHEAAETWTQLSMAEVSHTLKIQTDTKILCLFYWWLVFVMFASGGS